MAVIEAAPHVQRLEHWRLDETLTEIASIPMAIPIDEVGTELSGSVGYDKQVVNNPYDNPDRPSALYDDLSIAAVGSSDLRTVLLERYHLYPGMHGVGFAASLVLARGQLVRGVIGYIPGYSSAPEDWDTRVLYDTRDFSQYDIEQTVPLFGLVKTGAMIMQPHTLGASQNAARARQLATI